MNLTLFYRLLLAFLIADYPLQTDGVFRVRYEKRWGVFLHAGIHLVVTLALCLPYLHSPWFILAVLLLQVGHAYFDKVKKTGVRGFVLDQFTHFASLALIAIIFANLHPNDWLTGTPADLWHDDYLINLLSGMLLATYVTMILVNFINRSLRKRFTRDVFSTYYRYSMVFCGLVVYACVVPAVQLHPFFLAPAVLPPIALAFIARRNGDDDGSFNGAYPADYLLSLLFAGIWAVLVGLKLYP